jgi:phage-related baseplate assembly protein
VVEDSRLCAGTRTNMLRPSHVTSESKKLSAGMTATLSAELEGRVPDELVAEIVRAVLDESRRAAQDRVGELTMVEARVRLERFIRARGR